MMRTLVANFWAASHCAHLRAARSVSKQRENVSMPSVFLKVTASISASGGCWLVCLYCITQQSGVKPYFSFFALFCRNFAIDSGKRFRSGIYWNQWDIKEKPAVTRVWDGAERGNRKRRYCWLSAGFAGILTDCCLLNAARSRHAAHSIRVRTASGSMKRPSSAADL